MKKAILSSLKMLIVVISLILQILVEIGGTLLKSMVTENYQMSLKNLKTHLGNACMSTILIYIS